MGQATHAGTAPIGVFDSGIGGLSVLAALRARLPRERFVYYADTAHAPYGERGDAFVAARTREVAGLLVREHGVKALVVACNTATAAAIHLLREAWPALPIVGVEPALKPALALSRTGHVAVLATRGTLASGKFGQLAERLTGGAGLPPHIRPVPCDGLADAIEQDDLPRVRELCARYLQAAGPLGSGPGQADVVVLGCTHYPFVLPVLRGLVPAGVRFVETGEPVARQTERLLGDAGRLASEGHVGDALLLASGSLRKLHGMVEHLATMTGAT